MTTIETLSALDAAGDRATQGECEMRERRTGQRTFAWDIVGNVYRDAHGNPVASTPVATVREGYISAEDNARYIIDAANARPALKQHLAAVARLVEAARAITDGPSIINDPRGYIERKSTLAAALKEVDRG